MRRNTSPSSSIGSSESSTSRETRHERNNNNNTKTGVAKLVAESAMIIIARRGCCMYLVVKALVERLGVNPKALEMEEADEAAMLEDLSKIEGGGPRGLPAVYVGGRLLGGLNEVISTHVNGEFVPMLRAAGAL